jgi:hypothetical protein
MTAKNVELTSISLPHFDLPQSQPEISKNEYENRIEMARARAAEAGLDFLLVYGDREHFANLAFLTSHDPRFEEAMLVIASTGDKPILILGNEGLVYSELIPIDVERKLYQGFSLLGQKRSTAPRLEPVLRDCGIRPGSRIGLAGWKYVTEVESDDPDHWLDAPSFIVDALRTLTGNATLIINATSIFMDSERGLRVDNSAAQLAAFEFGAAHCSQAVRNAIENLQPGITELEAVRNMGLNGLPSSAHLMFSTGPRARLGLSSPEGRVIQLGDSFFVAFGLRGGLTARGGFVVNVKAELPSESVDYLDRLVKPYFSAVVAWYETVSIGVTGGELQTVVEKALAGQDIDIALNPGHLIHLDEWLHSPVYAQSTERLSSGMLIQCDIIPVIDPKYHTTNAEDTIALADQSLRDQLAATYPELWQRVEARRDFMQNVLGIQLKPDVLPFSNMAGMLSPFVLNPNMVMVANS